MIEKLTNCPNCGGYLNDSGRCEFCGSKVYDFVNVDFDDNTRTYIRVKRGNRIAVMPVVFTTYRYEIRKEPISVCEYDTAWKYIHPYADIEGTLDFFVVGDVLYETNEVDS